jgi:flagellar biosynthesis/type III secretory pathway chaperone
MSVTATVSEPTSVSAPIATAADAEALVAHTIGVMDELIEVVEQETELMRAGRLNAALRLAQPKSDLSRLYIVDTRRLQANQPALARVVPDTLIALRQRHAIFQSLLQTNLTVLATAHAVSEGIVRGVSSELARKATPQIYGASGRATPAGPSAATPLTLSRAL